MDEAFWARVDKSSNGGCWEWQGPLWGGGYGQFNYDGTAWVASRYAYLSSRGQHPGKMLVCHKCDNKRCVRPDHLFLGTSQDNMVDKVNKGRHRHVNGRSAKLTEDQVSAIRASERRGSEEADSYGVSRATISLIRSGKRWGKCVQDSQ